MAETTAWIEARTYPDPEGRGLRLNDVAAARAVGLQPRIFRPLQQNGFFQWQGSDCKPRRLDAVLISPPEGGPPEETYLESQVQELRAVLQTTPEERYRKMGCVNREMLGKKLGINALSPQGKTRLDEWEQDGKLTPKETPSPVNGKRTIVYPIAEADALATECLAIREKKMIRREGKDYLHLNEVCKTLGVIRNTINSWGEYGIVPLGGEELDRIRTPAPGTWRVWIEAVRVERIRVALESRPASHAKGLPCPIADMFVIEGETYLTQVSVENGRGLTSPVCSEVMYRLVRDKIVRKEKARSRTRGSKRDIFVYHQQDLQDFIDARGIAFDGVFETEEGTAFSVARAVVELRERWQFTCSRFFLQEQVKKSRYLPDGKLPALRRKPPSLHRGWRSKEIISILQRDLANMVATIKGLVETGNNLDPDWKDAADIGRILGYDRSKTRNLSSLLKLWRESGELTNVRRVWWDKRGQRRQVYVYYIPDVVRLAGETEQELTSQTQTMPGAESRGSRYEGDPLPQQAYTVQLSQEDRQTQLEILAELRTLNQHIREKNSITPLFDSPGIAAANGKPLTHPPQPSIIFSPTFDSVSWGSQPFSFSPQQAACVRVMWEAKQKGINELHQLTILDESESNLADYEKPQLRRLFRKSDSTMHGAWGKMIVPGRTKGHFCIADPPV